MREFATGGDLVEGPGRHFEREISRVNYERNQRREAAAAAAAAAAASAGEASTDTLHV